MNVFLKYFSIFVHQLKEIHLYKPEIGSIRTIGPIGRLRDLIWRSQNSKFWQFSINDHFWSKITRLIQILEQWYCNFVLWVKFIWYFCSRFCDKKTIKRARVRSNYLVTLEPNNAHSSKGNKRCTTENRGLL